MSVFSKPQMEVNEPSLISWKDYINDPTQLSQYKLPQLKTLAKQNGLYVSGTKPVIAERIIAHFVKCWLSVKLQAHARRHITQKEIMKRGVAFRNRGLCVNDSDFFTLERVSEIGWTDFFSYTDDAGFVYGFDISSLISMIKTGNTMNPYTRKDLGETVLRDIADLRKYTTPTEDAYQRILASRQKPLSQRISDVFYELDYLGHYTDARWLTNLDRPGLMLFNRTLYDIWHYIFDLPVETKRNICPFFNPFKDGYKTVDFIPVDESNDDMLQNSITFIENLIYSGTTIEFRRLGSFQVLTAMTKVSRKARNQMPYLYEAIA